MSVARPSPVMADGIETLGFLAASPARTDVLRALAADPDRTERDLRDRLPHSRSTVHRALAALVDRGFLAEDPTGYTVTTSGEIALEAFDDATETLAAATRLQPFLRHVPREDFDADLRWFADAEVTVGTPSNPLAMVERHAEALADTADFRAVLPLTGRHPYEVQHRRTLDGRMEGVHVVAPGVAETFATAFADITRDLFETDAFELYVTDEPIPYFLGLLDDTVQLGADSGGDPVALVETDDPRVREWATDRFEAYRRSADPAEDLASLV